MEHTDYTPFINLLNRNGFVLDFTDPSFYDFINNSIDIDLSKYEDLSKGNTLKGIITDDNISDNYKIKLLSDFLDYYENSYSKFATETGNGTFNQIYNRCKEIIKDYRSKPQSYVLEMGIRFSNQYINEQIELMSSLQNSNPTEAIGKAKELIESACKTILYERGITDYDKYDLPQLARRVFEILEIIPNSISDKTKGAKAIKAILGNLQVIVYNIAQLRNEYGSGHGKSPSYKGLEERHAKLAIGSSATLINFLWDSHLRKSISDK